MAQAIKWTIYVDDDANNISIKMGADNIAAQAAVATDAPATAVHWPYGKHNLRHITGKEQTTGVYARLVILDEASALWQGTALNWTNPTTTETFNVLGHFGERKPQNEVA